MAQEIEWAAGAGIDFWAFDYYKEGSNLALALELYLAANTTTTTTTTNRR